MDKLVKKVLASRVYEVVSRTPLERARKLSKALNNNIYFKREDVLPVRSFKLRGAYNKMAQLSPAERKKGVITASAGNHAQGVAYSAQKLGLNATIVMPETTPEIKVEAVKSYGAKVVLHGENYSESAAYAAELVKKTGKSYIHPFDDDLVIAGQGTIGLEIFEQLPEVDYVFVPIGGGGLIAGIASYLKEVKPRVKVIGVEPEDSNAMSVALKHNRRVRLEEVGIFADGVATKDVGAKTFRLTKKYVDNVVLVSNDAICAAIKTIYDDSRTILEPAGALATAGAQKYLSSKKVKGKNVAVINSGANMNFERLQFVAERALTGLGAEALYAVTLQERAGALDHFYNHVADGYFITEFNYRLAERSKAHIYVGIRVKKPSDKQAFQQRMERHKYSYVDLTYNELAKDHIRHMVGGKATSAKNELIIQFMFPERPGAMKKFLAKLRGRWNISLFHYRANGSDAARVLVGMEVPPEDDETFQAFLAQLGYPSKEETDNVAYQVFL